MRGKGSSGSGSRGKGTDRQSAAVSPGGYDIFINNLLEETTADELAEFFGKAGNIIRPPRLNTQRGFAWVTFDTLEAVTEATSWSGSYLGARRIHIYAAKNVASTSEQHSQFQAAHLPALCEETVAKLVAPNLGGVYVDGTFGRGGHTRAMLAAMSPTGEMHAFDMDPEAIKVGKELMAEDSRFTIHHAPFSSMRQALKSCGRKPGSVSGVLLDVGISSPQFNDTSRGFRPEADGPLDLRFDTSRGVPASEFLKTVPHTELARIIDQYGEESVGGAAARRIADAICLARSRGELPTRTMPFAELVARARGKETSGQVMHPAKMTFQALRIHLNDEFDEMRRGVRAAFKLLGEGGRIGIISWKFSERKILDEVFHSTPCHTIAEQSIASHRIASHRTASHCIAYVTRVRRPCAMLGLPRARGGAREGAAARVVPAAARRAAAAQRALARERRGDQALRARAAAELALAGGAAARHAQAERAAARPPRAAGVRAAGLG